LLYLISLEIVNRHALSYVLNVALVRLGLAGVF